MENVNYIDNLIEDIKQIDTTNLKDGGDEVSSKVIEEQKVYFWVRLYLKEENEDIRAGDNVIIKWVPTGETLETKFISFGKKGLDKDNADQITSYDREDDKKILSLMIETKMVNLNEKIPFIRTLFKTSYHYEYQLIQRDELIFTNQSNGIKLDYYDCDF